VAASCWGR